MGHRQMNGTRPTDTVKHRHTPIRMIHREPGVDTDPGPSQAGVCIRTGRGGCPPGVVCRMGQWQEPRGEVYGDRSTVEGAEEQGQRQERWWVHCPCRERARPKAGAVGVCGLRAIP